MRNHASVLPSGNRGHMLLLHASALAMRPLQPSHHNCIGADMHPCMPAIQPTPKPSNHVYPFTPTAGLLPACYGKQAASNTRRLVICTQAEPAAASHTVYAESMRCSCAAKTAVTQLTQLSLCCVALYLPPSCLHWDAYLERCSVWKCLTLNRPPQHTLWHTRNLFYAYLVAKLQHTLPRKTSSR